MPLYFFDFVDGADLIDDVGVELPDFSAVRQEAIVCAGQIIRDEHATFRDGEPWEVRVRDQAGHVVLRLHFKVETNTGSG